MPVRRMKSIEEITGDGDTPDAIEERPGKRVRRPEKKEVVVKDEKELFVEDDEDARPKRSSIVQAGWKAAKEVSNGSGGGQDWINDFRWTEDQQLVKFLTEDPMSYRQHWVDRTSGKRSHVCLGRDCPMCEAGNTPSPRHVFSVVNLSDEEPTLYMLVVSNRVLQQLESHHTNPKTGPLTRGYWALSRSGHRQSTVHNISFVKERDLEEDWGIDPEWAAEVVATKEPATAEDITITSREEMRAIVDGG